MTTDNIKRHLKNAGIFINIPESIIMFSYFISYDKYICY